MCGICGIIKLDSKPVKANELIQMRDILQHRGPDDAGIFMEENVGLGHRRLSIIDLGGSHQPMSNEDETIWLSYNGEIYNYKEIREFLTKKAHTFKTKGDAEVIIHLYEEFDENLFDMLNGMYAFAIWDKRKKKLLLARDRLGIKPLYYSRTNDTFLFASEIKAILAYKGFERKINIEQMNDFLAFGYIYSEETLFKNIHKLLPGHTLVMKDGNMKLKKYWDIEFNKEKEESTKYYVENIDKMLRDSVRLRLVSDVPIGAFLSGGIDSSLIVYYMSQLNDRVRTFTVGFPTQECDESKYAQEVAQRFHTEHYEVKIGPQDFFGALTKLIWYNDEPIWHPSSIPIYFVARLARQKGVKLLLSGEGADELFAGYASYPAYVRDTRFRKIVPKFLVHPVMRLLSSMGKAKLSEIVERCSFSEADLLRSHTMSHFRSIGELMDRGSNRDSFFEGFFADLPKGDALSKILYFQLKTGLVTLLLRQDKMSMAASVESRVPYLDHRLVQFALGIPSKLKLCRKTRKVILREIGKQILPKETMQRQKMGFPVPLKDWLQSDLVVQLLQEVDRPYLRKKEILRIADEYRKNKCNHTSAIWGLLNLELWTRIFFEKKDF